MMDRQIRRLALAFLALFVVLFAQANYLQVFASSRYADNPANQRLLLQEYAVDRGDILARDGRTVLARSRATKGKFKYLRIYPNGPLFAGITGYYSLVFGRYGLEAAENDYLAGRAPELLPQNLVDEILGRPNRGATVVTTINSRLQQVARRALGSLSGGVVALDPRTGEVLAMVANPTYDPNPLSSHDAAVVRQAPRAPFRAPWKTPPSPGSPGPFPPGSAFQLGA